MLDLAAPEDRGGGGGPAARHDGSPEGAKYGGAECDPRVLVCTEGGEMPTYARGTGAGARAGARQAARAARVAGSGQRSHQTRRHFGLRDPCSQHLAYGLTIPCAVASWGLGI